jgi:hypothetical protein
MMAECRNRLNFPIKPSVLKSRWMQPGRYIPGTGRKTARMLYRAATRVMGTEIVTIR